MSTSSRIATAIEITRPGQWVKNLLVLAGLFFALADRSHTISVRQSFLNTMLAFVLFCLISGAVYIMNDLHDAEADRVHPGKKNRPIASGQFPVTLAVVEYFVLLLTALKLSTLLGPVFAINLAAYFLLQSLYTYALKNWVLVDVFAVAIGFVMRVLAGTLAAGVWTSPWLLLCTFMAALFLILCKRREEKVSLGDEAPKHRHVLAFYETSFLDHLITATAAVTIVCYAIYSVAPQTVARFGTESLVLTVPFVAFGIFRYLYLVICCGQGGQPEKTLTRDLPTVLNILLYLAIFAAVIFGVHR